MSVAARPSVPAIQTTSTTSDRPPPPPPPKSPLRSTSAISRRRGDGRVITLTLPTPLSALDAPTPPLAESVPIRSSTRNDNESRRGGGGGGSGGSGRREQNAPAPPMSPTSPMSPGATLREMRRQTRELRERTKAQKQAQAQSRAQAREEATHYPLPLSPIQIQSTRRPAGARRESSLSRLSRRLSLSSRRPSMNLRKSFRKNLTRRGSGVSNGNGQQGVKKRQSISDLARRESVKLKSILKITQPLQVRTQDQIHEPDPTHAQIEPTPAPAPVDERPSTGPTPPLGSGYALVAQKKVGATWHPPQRKLERRQSAKLRDMLKPNSRPGSTVHRKLPLPVGEDCPMKPSGTSDKTEGAKSKQSSQRSSLDEKADAKRQLQDDKPSFEIVAAPAVTAPSQTQTQPQTQEEAQAARQFRDGKEVLSEIETKHLSAAEARRLIRQHNREYFHSKIWDPALQRDFAGAYQLANERDETAGAGPSGVVNIQAQTQTQTQKRDSLQTLLGPAPPEKDKRYATDKDDWRRYENLLDAEDWGRNVRLAMARLEDKITTEATTDPVRFMKARRESAQLRAWIAAQRRTSEARLSAIAMGRVRPESPFEQAFVAELLKENDIKLKHSSNPMLDAQKLFKDIDSKKNSLLPHYVPFSQHPLLEPLEEIEAEAKQQDNASSESTLSDEKPVHVLQRRFSVFDEKKAARRAGRGYKSLSTSTQLDQLEMHEARCCGLWKPKAFVDKIS
ncbi:hypothetical protein ACEPAH_6207 [Sanghuangporus vaninii]